jgi:uncharacterized protein involved in response to NO
MRRDPRPPPANPLFPLRNDPWRVLFPIAVLLGWAGVLHWLLYALGATSRYDPVFHAVAQIQGFITGIAFGFLLTFVPRRTGTAPPSTLTLAAGVAAPVASTIAAWQGRWALAQIVWALCVAVVTLFVVRRLVASGGAPGVPAVFVWVPVALLAGIGGAALVAIATVLGPHEEPELWRLGRGFLLQGLVTALVVGVGGTMAGALTRGEPGPGSAPGARTGRWTQIGAAVLFLASFPLEVYVDARLGFTLRAVVAGGVLVVTARLWRPPSLPGLHRRLIWISGWLLPLGYLLAAIAPPDARSAALHVTFIGAFALIALSVSLHVALSHGGHPERLARSPGAVRTMGALLLAAVAARLLAGTDPVRLKLWLAMASTCFLVATIAWASLALPAVLAAGRRAG